MAYNFIEDPGHGWLEVPVTELHRLGIANKISAYSYRNGAMAYLEEDCDMGTFADAKRAHGETFGIPDLKTRYEDPTPIRSYPRYYA